MKYKIVFDMEIIDYNDPYNKIIKDIKHSPKITTKFEHIISVPIKPTSDLIKKIIETMLSYEGNDFKIVSYKYLRTEAIIDD